MIFNSNSNRLLIDLSTGVSMTYPPSVEEEFEIKADTQGATVLILNKDLPNHVLEIYQYNGSKWKFMKSFELVTERKEKPKRTRAKYTDSEAIQAVEAVVVETTLAGVKEDWQEPIETPKLEAKEVDKGKKKKGKTKKKKSKEKKPNKDKTDQKKPNLN